MKQIHHGILLRKLHYSETSLILHFFTLEKGFLAYIFKGGKKKKGNMLQVLSIIEITSYFRAESDLGQITEINAQFISQNIALSPVKSAVAFFMGEILYQIVKNNDEDQDLYHLLCQEIKWLDASHELTNYPLWFVLHLLKELGFQIHVKDPQGKYFDLLGGEISNQTPANPLVISGDVLPVLIRLLGSKKEVFLSTIFSKKERKQLLGILIQYIQIHVPDFKPLKSLPILEVLLED